MNKIKLLYDVIQKMKENEDLQGQIRVVVEKDGQEYLNLFKRMERCTVNKERGQDHEVPSFNKCGFMAGHHLKCGGVKANLSRISFLLYLLNILEAKEENGKRYLLLSINKNQLPEELAQKIKEHCAEGHEQHCRMNINSIEDADVRIEIEINQDNSLEKALLKAEGQCLCDDGKSTQIKAVAEVKLT